MPHETRTLAEVFAETSDDAFWEKAERCFSRGLLQPLTEEEREYVRACVKSSRKRLMAKECFHNSQRILLLGDQGARLTYWEGRARRTGEGWIHHGWLTITGKVVDPTFGAWAQLGLKLYVPARYRNDPRWKPERGEERRLEDEYEGRPFRRDRVLTHVSTSRAFGAMLDSEEVLIDWEVDDGP